MIGWQKVKKCSECFIEKPLTEFNNSNKYGKQSKCRQCYKAYFKAWAEARKAQKQQVVVQSKVCIKCHLEKPISQFGKRSINLDKKNDYCKSCWKNIVDVAMKKYRSKNA